MVEQVLDSMDIERERGITIKAQTVRLDYVAQDGKSYILNLMDTPGHVDFAYEVSRSLAACEGSLLVVDASQGVEAQTLANVYQALDAGHEIVPVLNKIDLPAAEPERIKQQIEDVIGLDASEAVPISAKTGLNIEGVLEAIVTRLPPPKGDETAPLKALLVDSWYDAYLGVVVLVRVIDGALKKGQRIRMMARRRPSTRSTASACSSPRWSTSRALGPGEIGFITAQIKEVADTRVGDTITDERKPTAEALPGFKPAQPVVFCGLFPVDAAEFEDLRAAMGRLRLNDASFSYEMESSAALGFGFRCGFLGLLHLEIIQERLEREFNLDLIATAPSVIYQIALRDGSEIELHNPADMPDVMKIEEIQEPWIRATILTPDDYLGGILKLCQDRRGVQIDLNYVGKRAMVIYDLPLNEVVFDFYDRLKSISKGYASLRLPHHRLPGRRPREDVDPGQCRAGRRALDAGAPRPGRDARPRHGREAEGPDPAAHVPDPGPGGDRRQDHRPRDHPGAAQGRHGQVLRRRRHPQAQAAGEAEGGQEEDAPVRQGRDPAGGLHRRAEDGRVSGRAAREDRCEGRHHTGACHGRPRRSGHGGAETRVRSAARASCAIPAGLERFRVGFERPLTITRVFGATSGIDVHILATNAEVDGTLKCRGDVFRRFELRLGTPADARIEPISRSSSRRRSRRSCIATGQGRDDRRAMSSDAAEYLRASISAATPTMPARSSTTRGELRPRRDLDADGPDADRHHAGRVGPLRRSGARRLVAAAGRRACRGRSVRADEIGGPRLGRCPGHRYGFDDAARLEQLPRLLWARRARPDLSNPTSPSAVASFTPTASAPACIFRDVHRRPADGVSLPENRARSRQPMRSGPASGGARGRPDEGCPARRLQRGSGTDRALRVKHCVRPPGFTGSAGAPGIESWHGGCNATRDKPGRCHAQSDLELIHLTKRYGTRPSRSTPST